MTNLFIRAERPADHATIDTIQEAAFGRPDEARLVRALRAACQKHLSLVGISGDEIVGHVFLSPVEIEGPKRAPACAGLAPLAVLPSFQRTGVGDALVRAALAECPKLDWKAVFLLGDPRYYGRFGFRLSAARGLRYESEAFDPAFQCLEIELGSLDGQSGRVRFHEAFDSL